MPRWNHISKTCLNCGETLPLSAFDRRPYQTNAYKKSCRDCVANWPEVRRSRAAERTMERFWAKVDKSGGPNACWFWTGYTMPNGYGHFSTVDGYVYTHRFSWSIVNGNIPEGMFICHTCDVRACVNPAHLFLGTALDNNRDTYSKGRGRSGVMKGTDSPSARLSDDDVREIRRLYSTGEWSQQRIADRYGVAQAHVSSIVLRKTWQHID